MRILSSDLLIVDAITPLAGNEALQALVAQYGLKPGGKAPLSREQFEAVSAAVEGYPVTFTPGGSSANVLTTLCKLLPGIVEVDFIGVAGESLYSSMIRHSLEEAHIRLLPAHLPPSGERPKTAVSYVMVFENGERTIATYPGNARDIVRAALVDDSVVANVDALLLQGSLWQKFSPDYAEKLLTLAKKYQKPIWLALPTLPNYHQTGGVDFRALAAEAALVLSNEEEMAQLYGGDVGQALAAMEKSGGTCFITRGEKGAFLVAGGKRHEVARIAPGRVVNTLGAGDTAFAGFLCGMISGWPALKSAQFAMYLAAEKLAHQSPRLPHPEIILKKFMDS